MAIHEPIHNHRDRDGRVVLNETEARQGVLGRPVLYVLVVGLILAMLAWAAAEFWGTSIDTQTPRDNTQVSTSATEPASENKNTVNNDSAPGDKQPTQPVIVDPQPTANQ
jgi:hypothetical protein